MLARLAGVPWPCLPGALSLHVQGDGGACGKPLLSASIDLAPLCPVCVCGACGETPGRKWGMTLCLWLRSRKRFKSPS